MHQTDAVSIKVSDGQLKDERCIATISSCLMAPGADQRLCTNRWCFLAGNCNLVALRENMRIQDRPDLG